MVYQITLARRGVQFDLLLRAPSRIDAMRKILDAAQEHDETKVLRVVEANELGCLLQSSLDAVPAQS